MKQGMESTGEWGRFEAEVLQRHAEGERATGGWHSQMVRIEDASGYEDHELDDLRDNNYIDNVHCWL